MNKTTRDQDLDILDQSRIDAQTTEGKEHREALLIQVYEMSKDSYLEKMRGMLELMIEDLETFKVGSMEYNRAFMGVEESKRRIKAYVNAPNYKKKIAEKIAKQVSTNEADLFMNKEI